MSGLSMMRPGGDSLGTRSADLRVRQRSVARAFAFALGALVVLATFATQARALEFVRPADGEFYNYERDGEAIHQQRIAVEHSTGNILVTNVVTDVIDVYAPDRTLLTSLGTGQLTDPFGIAVDQRTGAVYVSDSGRDRIVRYTVVAGAPPVYTLDAGFTGPGLGTGAGDVGDFAAALAIDPSADKLLVADPGNNLVKRFTLGGAYDSFSFGGSGSADGVFTGLLDLAVDSTGDVIVVDSTGDVARVPPASSRVLRFSSGGVYEDRIGASLDRAATVAVRPTGDQVVVSARQNAVELTPAVPPSIDVFSARGGDPIASVRALEGFQLEYAVMTGMASAVGADGRLYVAMDVDRTDKYLPDRWGKVTLQALDAIPATTPPAVSEERAAPMATSATLTATIATNDTPVNYYFEYGPVGSGYTERTASASLAAGSVPASVRANAIELVRDTAYQFRVVVDNGEDVVVGGGGRFETLPPPPTATVKRVTDVTRSAATLHATVDLQGAPGSYGFVIEQVGGPQRIEVPRVELPAGGTTDVSTRVEGLAAGQTYVVGITALTPGGYAAADPVAFTTAGTPPVIDPARTANAGSPYGCDAPRLDPVRGMPRAGQPLALTGADLGVYGIINIGGTQAEIRSYSANGVSVVVPEGLKGRTQLTLDCGKLAGAIPITIAGSDTSKATIVGSSVRGSVATLRVRTPAAGRLTAGGRYLRGASARLTRSGTATLKLRLTRAGIRALAQARSKRLRVTIAVRYAPQGGSTATTLRKAVVFKR